MVPAGGSTRSASTSPIIPLGALVSVLGYRMEWHGLRCRLIGRGEEVINLRVRDGCPEMTEHQALELYSKIEDKKLACLEKATADTKTKIRETVLALIRS